MQLCDSHDEAAKHRQTDGLPVMSRYAIEQCSGGGSFWSSPPTCSRKRMGPSVPTQTHRPGGPRPQRLISVICVTDSDSDDFEKGFGGPGGRNTKICHVGRTDHRQPEAVGSGHVDEPRGPLRIEPRGLETSLAASALIASAILTAGTPTGLLRTRESAPMVHSGALWTARFAPKLGVVHSPAPSSTHSLAF
jgi:hypothetical protein